MNYCSLFMHLESPASEGSASDKGQKIIVLLSPTFYWNFQKRSDLLDSKCSVQARVIIEWSFSINLGQDYQKQPPKVFSAFKSF